MFSVFREMNQQLNARPRIHHFVMISGMKIELFVVSSHSPKKHAWRHLILALGVSERE